MLRLVDAVTGAPVDAARVEARRPPEAPTGDFWDSDMFAIDLEVFADPDAPGIWRVPGPGRLATLLEVTAPGYAQASRTLPGIEPGEEVRHEWELVPEARVSGTVRDLAGAPLAEVSVHVHARDTELAVGAQATSGDDGRYLVEGLPPGEYVAEFRSQQHADKAVSPLVLTAGELRAGVDVALDLAGHVEGRLLRADGTPRGSRRVRLVRLDLAAEQDGDNWGWSIHPITHTRGDGTFGVGRVAPGRYARQVEGVATREVVVGPGDTVVLELVEQPVAMAAVTGGVTRNGEPLEGVRVLLDLPGQAPLVTTTDAEGHWRLDSEVAGPGRVRLTPMPPHANLTWPRSDWVDVVQGRVVHVDLSVNWVRLAGRVVGPDGAPAADSRLELRSEADAWPAHSVVSDAEGRFDLGWLPPRTYHLRLVSTVDRRLASHDVGAWELGPGEDRLDVELRHRTGAAISGRVRDARGLPVPDGVLVRLWPEGGAQPLVWARTEGGVYRLEHVPPGRHRVAALHADEGLREGGAELGLEVLMADGVDVTLDLIAIP